MKIDTVRLAELARLKLTPEEHALYSKQLDQVVEYVELLKEVDVKNVAPLVHPHAEKIVETPMREDRVLPAVHDKAGEGYKVPPIL